MTWKFNKDNWTYIADDNIEEFLRDNIAIPTSTEVVQESKPKTKRSKKPKQVL